MTFQDDGGESFARLMRKQGQVRRHEEDAAVKHTLPDEVTPSEVRIRREIRAMAYPLLAVAALIVATTAATTVWTGAIYALLALACIGRWQTERPRLPDDEEPFVRTIRTVPWLFALAGVAATTLAVGSVQAVFHPERWWAWPLLAIGIVTTAALALVLVIGRRNYERARTQAPEATP